MLNPWERESVLEIRDIEPGIHTIDSLMASLLGAIILAL